MWSFKFNESHYSHRRENYYIAIPGAISHAIDISHYLEHQILFSHPYWKKINSNWNKCKQIERKQDDQKQNFAFESRLVFCLASED